MGVRAGIFLKWNVSHERGDADAFFGMRKMAETLWPPKDSSSRTRMALTQRQHRKKWVGHYPIKKS